MTHAEDETAALAERLAARFRGGEVVLLSGELGAGKTAFVRGLARGVGADPALVSSPTFVLLMQNSPISVGSSNPTCTIAKSWMLVMRPTRIC